MLVEGVLATERKRLVTVTSDAPRATSRACSGSTIR